MEDINELKRLVHELIQKYEDHFMQYQQSSYNETEVRIDFVNPFFEILGWDVLNKKSLPQHLREVKHEADVVVSENGVKRKKKPDYSFKSGTEVCFFLETKKPSVDIVAGKDPAFQLRRYGWNGNLKVSILTNFTDLIIYDCSIRPVEDDEPSIALVARYHYTEYESKLEEIIGLLSKFAVLSGEFDKAFTNISTSLKKEPFDLYFLTQIKQWRNSISQDIVKQNLTSHNEALNIFVQRILNRILFMRICEDRNFEVYETLKGITTYEQLKLLFVSADRKYDSGLFNLLDDNDFIVSDETILSIFKDLYYPNSSYEFSVVDPHVIGQIYALFLEETVVINQDRTITTLKKPEAIDAQGAVNTPKNITDIIVNETLTPLFYGKTIKEIENYRIADICCGSGNFLLSAYEYIVNYYVEELSKKDLDAAFRRGDLYAANANQSIHLSFALKRKILITNLWGVDIDPLAVEVTKFSLYLKVLEGSFTEELNFFCKEYHEKILPDLDENIKTGNSLVDSGYLMYDETALNNVSLLTKLKFFDWNQEFEGTLFDAIIGNPPYIRVQNMAHYSSEEYNYYKSGMSGFQMASIELMDKYYIFIERGLSLLNEHGVLGYIIPHKFMTIKSGHILREWLSNKRNVRKILHFGTHQVFENRSTYTCVLILSKKENSHFQIGFVQDWNQYLFEHTVECNQYPANLLNSEPWIFQLDDITNILEKVADKCVPLNALADIFVGMQTSNDSIYILNPDREDDDYIYFRDKSGDENIIERDLLRKCIYDLPIKKYKQIIYNRYIVFPYKITSNTPILYTLEEMEKLFPRGYLYLNKYRHELDKRNMPKRTDETWYAYGRSQSLRRFNNKSEHLVWPVLSKESNYVFDSDSVCFTGGGNGPYYGLQMKPFSQISIYYIQAVLNHWLMECQVKNRASFFRGDYYSHGKQFVEALPVYNIDFSKQTEKSSHNTIVEKVKNVMHLTAQKDIAHTQDQKRIFARAINTELQMIEKNIDALYGIWNEEMRDKT